MRNKTGLIGVAMLAATGLAAAPSASAQELFVEPPAYAQQPNCRHGASFGHSSAPERHNGSRPSSVSVYVFAPVTVPKGVLPAARADREVYANLTGTLPNDPALNSGTIVFEDREVSPATGIVPYNIALGICAELHGDTKPRK